MMDQDRSISEELGYLRQQTGEDEAALLARAVRVGLQVLLAETVEKALIEETISTEEATAILGQERVKDIQYAKHALAQDVARGLGL